MTTILSTPAYQGILSSVQPRLTLVHDGSNPNLVVVGQFTCKDNNANCNNAFATGPVDYYAQVLASASSFTPLDFDSFRWTTSRDNLTLTHDKAPCLSTLDTFGQALQKFSLLEPKTIGSFYPRSTRFLLTHSTQGLVEYDAQHFDCASFAPPKPSGFNRTLTGAASSPGSTRVMVYGGIDTKGTTQTLSKELMVLDSANGTWVTSYAVDKVNLPAVYSPMLFAGATIPLSSNSSTLRAFYMLGGCTNLATALDRTDESGCLGWDTLYTIEGGYKTDADEGSNGRTIGSQQGIPFTARAIKVSASVGSLPPTTRSPCFAYIPSRNGLFVSGGFTKAGATTQTVAAQHWFLDFASLQWMEIKLVGDNPAMPLPTSDHSCTSFRDQVIVVGPTNATVPQTEPALWSIRVPSIGTVWTLESKMFGLDDPKWTTNNPVPGQNTESLQCGGRSESGCFSYQIDILIAVCSSLLAVTCLCCGYWCRRKHLAKKQKKLRMIDNGTKPASENDVKAYEARVLAEIAGGGTVVVDTEEQIPAYRA